MGEPEIAARYDLRGLKCPLPVLKTRKRMASLEPGALVWVETSDPLAVVDIPHFCREAGRPVRRLPDEGGAAVFLVGPKPA